MDKIKFSLCVDDFVEFNYIWMLDEFYVMNFFEEVSFGDFIEFSFVNYFNSYVFFCKNMFCNFDNSKVFVFKSFL